MREGTHEGERGKCPRPAEVETQDKTNELGTSEVREVSSHSLQFTCGNFTSKQLLP